MECQEHTSCNSFNEPIQMYSLRTLHVQQQRSAMKLCNDSSRDDCDSDNDVNDNLNVQVFLNNHQTSVVHQTGGIIQES
eukprot:2329620-Rhodomonas_salina.1